jgi:dTDP-4-amino-4,6-dideoxygalactose transaminase
MLHNPYKIVQMFEEEIAEYTGSLYAVALDSCTNAIFLCLKYLHVEGTKIEVPKRTYLSVPMSVIHAGAIPEFIDLEWSGIYQLKPTLVYDAAKRLTSNMYIRNSFMCLSFHIKKLLSIGKGGMILADDHDAVSWFKKARYEGRNEKFYKEDNIQMLGWNMYMTPQQAAHGLALMQQYPQYVPDMGEAGGYNDLTLNSVFKTKE